MIDLAKCLKDNNLTLPRRTNGTRYPEQVSLLHQLNDENLLTPDLVKMIVGKGFYPNNERLNMANWLAKAKLSDITHQAIVKGEEDNYPVADFFDAMQSLYDNELLSNKLVRWLATLKNDYDDKAKAFILVEQLGFSSEWAKEQIHANEKNLNALEAACLILKNEDPSQAQFIAAIQLHQNPLVYSAFTRSAITEFDDLEEFLPLLTRSLFDEETIKEAFNFHNQCFNFPEHQQSFDSQLLFSQDSEAENNDSGLDPYQIQQSQRYVHQQVQAYFGQLPLATISDYQSFINKLKEIKANGLNSELWDRIKYKVAADINGHNQHRHFDTYETLMQATEAGRGFNSKALDFRELLQASKGYRLFQNRALTNQGPLTRSKKQKLKHAFSKPETALDSLKSRF